MFHRLVLWCMWDCVYVSVHKKTDVTVSFLKHVEAAVVVSLWRIFQGFSEFLWTFCKEKTVKKNTKFYLKIFSMRINLFTWIPGNRISCLLVKVQVYFNFNFWKIREIILFDCPIDFHERGPVVMVNIVAKCEPNNKISANIKYNHLHPYLCVFRSKNLTIKKSVIVNGNKRKYYNRLIFSIEKLTSILWKFNERNLCKIKNKLLIMQA